MDSNYGTYQRVIDVETEFTQAHSKQSQSRKMKAGLLFGVCLAAALIAVIALTANTSSSSNNGGDSNENHNNFGEEDTEGAQTLQNLQARIFDGSNTVTLSADTLSDDDVYLSFVTGTATKSDAEFTLSGANCNIVGLTSAWPALVCTGQASLFGLATADAVFVAVPRSLDKLTFDAALSIGVSSGLNFASQVAFASLPSDTWLNQIASDSIVGNITVANAQFTVQPFAPFTKGVEVHIDAATASGSTFFGLERLSSTVLTTSFSVDAVFPFTDPATAGTATVYFSSHFSFSNAKDTVVTQLNADIHGFTSNPVVNLLASFDISLSSNPNLQVDAQATYSSSTEQINFKGTFSDTWNPATWISVLNGQVTVVVSLSQTAATLTTLTIEGKGNFAFDGTAGQGQADIELDASNNFSDWVLTSTVDLSKTASPCLTTLLSAVSGIPTSSIGDVALNDFDLSTANVQLVLATFNAPSGNRGLTVSANVVVADNTATRHLVNPVSNGATLTFDLNLFVPVFDSIDIQALTFSLKADLVQISNSVNYANIDLELSVGSTQSISASLDLSLNLKHNAQPVVFHVSAVWTSSTPSFNFVGDLTSSWAEPFGLDWLAINSASVSLTVNTGAVPSLAALTIDGKVSVTFASAHITNSYDLYLVASNNFQDFTIDLSVQIDSFATAVNRVRHLADSNPVSTTDLSFSSATIDLVLNTASFVNPQTGRSYLPGLTFEVDVATVVAGSSLYNKLKTFHQSIDTVQFFFDMYLPVFSDMTKGLYFKLGSTAIPINPNLNFDGFTLAIGIDVASSVTVFTGVSALFAKQPDWLTFQVGGTFTSTGEVSLEGDMIGSWDNVFGLKGFDITDPWIEIGFGPAGIESFGIGGKIQIGSVTIDLDGMVDIANPSHVFFFADIENLAFKDLAVAFNNAQQDGANPPIDASTIPSLLTLNYVKFSLAPVTSDILINSLPVHFDAGVALNASISLLGVDSLNVTMLTDWDPAHPNFIFSIALSFENLSDAFNQFMDSILPPEFLRPGVIEDLEKLIKDLSEIIPQLTQLSIQNLNMANLAHGIFPTVSMDIQLFGKDHYINVQLSLQNLMLKFSELFSEGIIDLKKILALPECIIDKNCPSGYHCSHQKGSMFQCYEGECAPGLGRVPIFGCVTCFANKECQYTGSSGPHCVSHVCSP